MPPINPSPASGGFASPQIVTMFRRFLAGICGFALMVAGLALIAAMLTYHADDPSLDTASLLPVRNWMGVWGADSADILLQSFGLAAGLTPACLLAWGWRLISQQGIVGPMIRFTAWLAAMPVLAAVLRALPSAANGVHPWPVMPGLGGMAGTRIAGFILTLGGDLGGWVGQLILVALLGLLAFLLVLMALGLSAGEWLAAGKSAAGAARMAGGATQDAAQFVRRWHRNFTPPPGYDPEDYVPDYNAQDYPPAPAPSRGQGAAAAAISPATAFETRYQPVIPPPPTSQSTAITAHPHVTQAARRPPVAYQETLPLDGPDWLLPAISLLKPAPLRANDGPSTESLEGTARLLEGVLGDYGVQGKIREIRPGPVVTLYELEPAPGIRSSRVIGLADDIARSLSVMAVRIATVPGRNVIGIEVPNSKRETVYLSELLLSEEWNRPSAGKLPLALGKDIGGEAVIVDLARMPHLLIAGTTGSGKSVGINAMILSLLYRQPPDLCKLIMIDPKMLELSIYEGIPHLLTPVVTEPGKAVTALKWAVREMDRRYRSMSQLGVRNVEGYNERVAEAHARGEVVSRRVQTGFDEETGRPMFEEQPLALERLPFIVIFIDEMADLMMLAGKEIEAAVQRLAQKARAAGLHVIMATQRPSVDVITGTIKANFPTRISYQVISKFDSRTILNEQGAEQLLGQGDLLHMAGGGRVTRAHGPFVSDREVEDVANYLRSQGQPDYDETVTEAPPEDNAGPAMSGIAGASDNEKTLFDQAIAVVAREGKASTSFIQRHLNLGYNRAAKLIEQMEREGIVGPANHVGKREVLVRRTHDDD